jgi:hypothetical protein
MTDDDPEEDAGVPESDPRHFDPAGDIADLVESGEFDIDLAEDQDAEELREFVRKAEAGEFDLRADPALEATVRIARALLEDEPGDGGTGRDTGGHGDGTQRDTDTEEEGGGNG